MSRPETIEKRYVGKLTKKALSFMKGLLQMDPTKRLQVQTLIFKPHKGTSLIRNSASLGLYSRTMPRALWWS